MNDSNTTILQTTTVDNCARFFPRDLFSCILSHPAFHAQGSCFDGKYFFPICDRAKIQLFRIYNFSHLPLLIDMDTKTKNLTSHDEIRQTIHKKGGGWGAINRLAELLGLNSATIVTMNISGARRQKNVLQGIADFLGQPVHGVCPSSKEKTA
ncbi:hypothetical protein [Desulfogranum japonicum]|uniref:hypothetical protein n=1 Tax=Desulfogranum japonicum TaxID=231447 RepID=UPI0004903166|nr:hypothetical protein [Desulfogranum japonicum]